MQYGFSMFQQILKSGDGDVPLRPFWEGVSSLEAEKPAAGDVKSIRERDFRHLLFAAAPRHAPTTRSVATPRQRAPPPLPAATLRHRTLSPHFSAAPRHQRQTPPSALPRLFHNPDFFVDDGFRFQLAGAVDAQRLAIAIGDYQGFRETGSLDLGQSGLGFGIGAEETCGI